MDGDTTLDQLELRDTKTGETRTLDVDGLFVAIGHDPRSQLVKVRSNWTPLAMSLLRKLNKDQSARCLRLR